jgi:Fur family transcriptional regulator, ferric uptake regulator
MGGNCYARNTLEEEITRSRHLYNLRIMSEPIATLDDALNRCQTLGMRVSRQRRFILELLWETQEHLSAREIYDRLNRASKPIGHTSVYQNLEALASKGVIECVERSEGRLYGNISDIHSHINLTDPEQIIDLKVELPPDLIKQVEQQTDTVITDYRIEFFGRRA